MTLVKRIVKSRSTPQVACVDSATSPSGFQRQPHSYQECCVNDTAEPDLQAGEVNQVVDCRLSCLHLQHAVLLFSACQSGSPQQHVPRVGAPSLYPPASEPANKVLYHILPASCAGCQFKRMQSSTVKRPANVLRQHKGGSLTLGQLYLLHDTLGKTTILEKLQDCEE